VVCRVLSLRSKVLWLEDEIPLFWLVRILDNTEVSMQRPLQNLECAAIVSTFLEAPLYFT
jgi:hypothetical protein